MMPAADGSAVAYSHYLDSTGLPAAEAHAGFEQALDVEMSREQQPAPATPQDTRAVLRAQIQAAGTDATVRALAGTSA